MYVIGGKIHMGSRLAAPRFTNVERRSRFISSVSAHLGASRRISVHLRASQGISGHLEHPRRIPWLPRGGVGPAGWHPGRPRPGAVRVMTKAQDKVICFNRRRMCQIG